MQRFYTYQLPVLGSWVYQQGTRNIEQRTINNEHRTKNIVTYLSASSGFLEKDRLFGLLRNTKKGPIDACFC